MTDWHVWKVLLFVCLIIPLYDLVVTHIYSLENSHLNWVELSWNLCEFVLGQIEHFQRCRKQSCGHSCWTDRLISQSIWAEIKFDQSFDWSDGSRDLRDLIVRQNELLNHWAEWKQIFWQLTDLVVAKIDLFERCSCSLEHLNRIWIGNSRHITVYKVHNSELFYNISLVKACNFCIIKGQHLQFVSICHSCSVLIAFNNMRLCIDSKFRFRFRSAASLFSTHFQLQINKLLSKSSFWIHLEWGKTKEG